MRWQTITERRAMRLLLDNERRRVLTAFMLRPSSVKAAADSLGLPLKTVHDRVRTLEQLGLVRVTHSQARRGRPIKHYRSSADGFFVPFHATASASLGQFIADNLAPQFAIFNAQLAKAAQALIRNPKEAGFRLYAQGGSIYSDLTPSAERFDALRDLLEPEAPALMLSLVPLRLTREDAKHLQRDMQQLLERYAGRGGPEGYIMHVGLTPGEWQEEG